MGTSLSAITNSRAINFNDIPSIADPILAALKADNFQRAKSRNLKGEYIEDTGEWRYNVWEGDDTLSIDFEGPYCFFPSIYENLTDISTIYRYHLIYRAKELGWWQDKRKELYKIVKILGGSEVIWLPDQTYNHLAPLMDDVWEGISYAELKSKMIAELGAPVRDYNLLSDDTVGVGAPEFVKEWFLDDFADLKILSLP